MRQIYDCSSSDEEIGSRGRVEVSVGSLGVREARRVREDETWCERVVAERESGSGEVSERGDERDVR